MLLDEDVQRRKLGAARGIIWGAVISGALFWIPLIAWLILRR
jgi:uncharacterized membrane protein